MIKFILYLLVIPIIIYAVDSVNINKLFKANKMYQAKIFYILIVFSLAYLVTNFLCDFLYAIK